VKAGLASLHGWSLFFCDDFMSAPPADQPIQRKRTIIYIDGFNFYYGAVKNSPYKWLNFQRFFTLLRPHDDICQIHYFTALVTGPNVVNQHLFLRALATCPLINVVLGNYKAKRVKCTITACTYGGERRINTVEEKRTDVNIAVQMMEDAYEDRCDRFILVSGDSDLVPAVSKVRGLGKEVFVYIPARDQTRGAAVELRSVASSAKILPLTILKHAQFSHQVSDGSGGFISKPATW
jgi:6-hydroxy-3-succinoylpyridine 3-monooxygenase